MHIDELENGMQDSVENCITLKNLKRDKAYNRFANPHTYEKFIQTLEKSTARLARLAFDNVCSSLYRQGHEVISKGLVAKVIDMRTYANWIDRSIETHPEGLAYHFKMMKNDGEQIIGGQSGGEVTWVTPYDELLRRLAPLRDSPDRGYHPRTKLSDDIRKALGLIFDQYNPAVDEPVYMVYLVYNNGLPSGHELHNPTIFDDGHWIWRSHGQDANWGMTVHLGTYSDSLPEAIHSGFWIQDAHNIMVYPLGRNEQPIDTNKIDKNNLLRLI